MTGPIEEMALLELAIADAELQERRAWQARRYAEAHRWKKLRAQYEDDLDRMQGREA